MKARISRTRIRSYHSLRAPTGAASGVGVRLGPLQESLGRGEGYRPRAASRHGSAEDPYGRASIAVYGLDRAGLVRERMARVTEMVLTCRAIVEVEDDLAGNPSALQLAKLSARLERY
jgi:hypothetical protein